MSDGVQVAGPGTCWDHDQLEERRKINKLIIPGAEQVQAERPGGTGM